MRDFTTDQLNVLLNALTDHAKTQNEHAAAFEPGGELAGVDAMREIAPALRTAARTADRLRNEAAAELHKRGRTGCDLAHPGHACPHTPAIGN